MRDITGAELDREWTTAELAELPRGETYWNPFGILIMAGNERANELGKAWTQLHDGPGGGPAPEPIEDDPFEELLADATAGPSPMIAVGGGEAGFEPAIFPRVIFHTEDSPQQRQREADWEARSIEMHDNQSRVDLADVPEREDETIHERLRSKHRAKTEEPVKFHELPEAERNKLLRGD